MRLSQSWARVWVESARQSASHLFGSLMNRFASSEACDYHMPASCRSRVCMDISLRRADSGDLRLDLSKHGLGVADFELSWAFDVEGLHHTIDHQHRIPLRAQTHPTCAEVER